jgi:hypothetical protein
MENCVVEGCTKPILAKNMCAAHYQRVRQGKDLTKPVRKRKIKGEANELELFPTDPKELS